MARLLLLLVAALVLAVPGTALAQQPADDAAPTYLDPRDDPGAEEESVSEPELEAPVPAAPAPAQVPPLPLPSPEEDPFDVPVEEEELPLVTTATVPGREARMRADGKAAIPRGAPKRVRAIIAAANQIVGKPYKWGGGHAKLVDRGYDCSGAVSYALIRAGLLRSPLVSGTLARWAAPGAGRWLTVHANKGHVYLEVAGLRLDTSSVGDRGGRSGVRWRPVIGGRPRFTARHVLGL